MTERFSTKNAVRYDREKIYNKNLLNKKDVTG